MRAHWSAVHNGVCGDFGVFMLTVRASLRRLQLLGEPERAATAAQELLRELSPAAMPSAQSGGGGTRAAALGEVQRILGYGRGFSPSDRVVQAGRASAAGREL